MGVDLVGVDLKAPNQSYKGWRGPNSVEVFCCHDEYQELQC